MCLFPTLKAGILSLMLKQMRSRGKMLTFPKCLEIIKNRETKKLGNNTYLVRDGQVFHVRFHKTNILTIDPMSTFTYRTGGWRTVTTKQRLNEYGPVSIYSKSGIWYCTSEKGNWVFQEECVFDFDGYPFSEMVSQEEEQRILNIKKAG